MQQFDRQEVNLGNTSWDRRVLMHQVREYSVDAQEADEVFISQPSFIAASTAHVLRGQFPSPLPVADLIPEPVKKALAIRRIGSRGRSGSEQLEDRQRSASHTPGGRGRRASAIAEERSPEDFTVVAPRSPAGPAIGTQARRRRRWLLCFAWCCAGSSRGP
ncbi:unnamed protein product [Prorocentrum cordatum]|uniref:Uncharacterized protein n=1 Tax=Prorocentrum cordatum TaxID=2364126 RepID=A0ABN9V253_9DINO|nr:unnamed protein product [Polarella glacialis]